MGAIQQSMNSMLGSVAGAVVASKVGKAADSLGAEKAAKEKTAASYGNQVDAIVGEALATNPKLEDAKYMKKALRMAESKKRLMMSQRDAWRQYRNSLKDNPEAYAEAEQIGQERKQKNLDDLKQSLSRIGKPGRPKK